MSRIAGDVNVTRLTIPGTHDSHATADNVKQWDMPTNVIATQWYSIADQLRFGVRYLDLRCGYEVWGKDIIMCHDKYKLNGTLSSVLDTIAAFLEQNSSETVLVSIKWDMGNEPYAVRQDVYNYWTNKGWWKNHDWPKLGDVRGQAVLLRRFAGDFGINFEGKFGDQDHTQTSEGKWHQQDDGKFIIGPNYWDDVNELWRRVWENLNYSKGNSIDDKIMYFNDLSAWSIKGPRKVSEEMNPRVMGQLAEIGNANIDPKRQRFGVIILDGIIPENALRIITRNFQTRIYRHEGLNQGFGELCRFENGVKVFFQSSDGNLVVYDGSGNPLWASNTSGSGANNILVHKMRGLQLKKPGGQWGTHVWWTGPDDNYNIQVTFMAYEPWVSVNRWNYAGEMIWSSWDQGFT